MSDKARPNLIFLTVGEAAEVLDFNISSIRSLIANHQIPFYQIGNSIRLEKREIETWIQQFRKPSGKAQLKTPEKLMLELRIANRLMREKYGPEF